MKLINNKQMSTPIMTTLLIAVACGALVACRSSENGGSDKGWQGAQLIETYDAGDAIKPQIAVDAIGNGLAVWVQFDGSRSTIWANRHTPTGGWEKAERINSSSTWYPSVSNLQVVLGSTGNGFAVWSERISAVHVATSYLVANRYTPVDGWEGPQEFYNGSSPSYCAAITSPKVALDVTNNDLLVVWEQYTLNEDNRNPTNIMAGLYTSAAGWGGANLLETDDDGDASGPQIAIDTKGNGLSAWAQSDGTRSNIWANTFINKR